VPQSTWPSHRTSGPAGPHRTGPGPAPIGHLAPGTAAPPPRRSGLAVPGRKIDGPRPVGSLDVADAPDDTPYQSLYRRFRPSTFAEVKGQDHVVLALRNAVRDRRVAHAYLFSGPRGTGKTSTARILAKALNCTDLRDGEPCGVCVSCVEIAKGTSLDVHELDAASNNGVEAMRDLVSRAALGTPGRQKVYIVDEVHMLSTAASNALLKTLEEPPAHVIFVLATTDPQKVLPTIRSRTQHFEFRLLGPETLGELLDQVRRDAHLEVPDEALDLAVRRGRGSARDALSILDQVAASDSVDDDLPELDEVVEALAERDIGRALVAVAHLTSAGFSPQQLTGDLVDYLRQGFLAMVAPELMTVSGTERDALSGRAERVGLAALVRAMEVLGRAQVDMRDAPDPRVNLEVALVRLAHPEADDSPEALLARIERLEAGVRTAGGGTPSAPAVPVVTAPATPVPAPEPATPAAAATPAGSAHSDSGSSEPEVTDPMSAKPTLGALRREAAAAPEGEGAGSTGSARSSSAEPTPASAGTGETASAGMADTPSAENPSADPPASEPPVPAIPTPSGPFPTRDQLVQAWGDHVIGRLRPKAKALFQAGRFVGVDGDRAVFGLPNETHRNRCEEVRGEIEAALSEQFGRPVGVDLVVDPGAEPARSRAGSTPDETRGPSSVPPGRQAESPSPAGPTPAGTSSAPGSAAVPSADADGPVRGEPDRHDEPDDQEDPSVFDDAHLGEVADVDNSAEARVLSAFPGAEEVG
jgi:DNA polymerase III subunit gamma/tau